MNPLRKGLLDSLPIVIGYLPIAFSFGLSATQAGLSAGLAVAISALVFAGGSQFVLLGMMTAGGGLLGIVGTVLLMNGRHLLYGRTIAEHLPIGRTTLPRPLLAFGLTDEVFATAIGKIHAIAPFSRPHWLLGLQTGAYLAWVGGTVLGALTGAEVARRLPLIVDMLSFVLPALFLSLLLSLDWRHQRVPVLVSLLATPAMMYVFPASAAIPACIVLGASCALFGRKSNV
jgi:4-azaleucine resistance transporter AzlC